MRKKLKVLSILIIIIFLSAAVIGIFKQEKKLKAGILTKGRILYKSSGMKKADEEKQAREKAGTQIEEGTAIEDATEGKVLVHFEFWDKDGKKHTGTYYAVSPANVQSGVSYGANGIEFTGTLKGKFLPQRTGQTNSSITNDDGMYRKGYTGGYTNADGSWDGATRFTDNLNGTATDNLTGLMWTTNADLYGSVNWTKAVTNAKNCSVGGYSDWRLPNVRELQSLIDYGNSSPTLPTGHPFQNVQNGYWTSTTYVAGTDRAWRIDLNNHDSHVIYSLKFDLLFYWYCRAGQ